MEIVVVELFLKTKRMALRSIKKHQVFGASTFVAFDPFTHMMTDPFVLDD